MIENQNKGEDFAAFINDNAHFIALGKSPVEELRLKWQGEEDLQELRYILGDLLSYPSTELAHLHRDANRLGEYDVVGQSHLNKKMKSFEEVSRCKNVV